MANKKGSKQLTWTNRLQIEAWQKAGISKKKMAAFLGVSLRTVYNELSRGEYTHLNTDYTVETRYSPDIAEKKYQEHLRGKGPGLKIGSDHEYAEYVEKMIGEKKYSPEAVIGEIRQKGLKFNTSLSKQTIYRYIEQGIFLTLTNDSLPIKKNKKVKEKTERKKAARAPKGKSIEERPKEVDDRSNFGHWEMDSVEGKKGTKATLLVLTERASRKELIELMKDKTAGSVLKALNRIERRLGKARFAETFKTITVDNGSEFSDGKGIETSAFSGNRTTLFYCHPYSAYERGSNENQNKMIRRHLPKGTDFTKLTSKQVKQLENWINEYPRKIFDYLCSNDVFEGYLNALES